MSQSSPSLDPLRPTGSDFAAFDLIYFRIVSIFWLVEERSDIPNPETVLGLAIGP